MEPQQTDAHYDIIIVGAGTAGCVLANRLSANSHISVLLLEAGENRNDDPNVYTPGLSVALLNQPEYDWQYTTVAEPGLNGRVINQPRGKIFGGSSAINSFALMYPNKAGIDVWESMGAKGWNWAALEPYYKKFQSINEPAPDVRQRLSLAHRTETVAQTSGELQASFPAEVLPFQMAWVDAWQSLGLENNGEALEGTAFGGLTSTCHIHPVRKERSHAGNAFLAPISDRSNLTVVKGAIVDRVLFSKDSTARTMTASAVSYSSEGKSHTARCRSEIILAAGAFGSPAILERSGIGDRHRLASLDVPLSYHNSAVGENLQDHIRAGISFEAADHVPPRSQMPDSEARRLYEEHRTGPWAASACWAFAYMPLPQFLASEEQNHLVRMLDEEVAKSKSISESEHIRYAFIRYMLLSPKEATATAYFSRKPAVVQASPTPSNATPNSISIFAMLAHSFSVGSSHVRSKSPEDKPEIICNYYQNDVDLEAHAHILKGLVKVASTPAIAKYIKDGGKREPPLRDDSSLDEAKGFLKQHAATNYHPVGTCAMLPEKHGGVVDSRLKVYGTSNLRIVDGSVIPVIPRANVITTIYAIAERGADFILEDLVV